MFDTTSQVTTKPRFAVGASVLFNRTSDLIWTVGGYTQYHTGVLHDLHRPGRMICGAQDCELRPAIAPVVAPEG